MRRFPFLPLFFIGLSVAFVIVLTIRLRSEWREPIAASRPSPPRKESARRTDATAPVGVPPAGKPAPSRNTSSDIARESARPRPALQPSPSQPKPKQSVIARALAPLVNALTGGGKSPAPKGGGGGAAPPPGQVAQQQQQQKQPDQQASKDPNSDTTPPQLLSIEFNPPQIHDGEESTVIVTAVDDLSGIRGISGTISSPTGKAMQGFATQRDGDSNRYLGRVAIPKSAESGLWKVRFLNLTDNASNSATLSDSQGTIPPSAVLRVISADSDSTPPTIKNIWVDRRAMHAGEKDIVYVEAVDDQSGVNLVSLVFQSPSKLARIGAGCQPGDGDVWRCELSAPVCVDCGDWQLEQVTLQDKANNLATYRDDNPIVQAVRVNIQGDTCANTAPALQSVALDSSDITVGPRGAVVTVTIVASSDLCSISAASGQYAGPVPGSGGVFPLQRSGDAWVGQIQLDPHAARGVWHITSIQLSDQGYNLRVYYAGDPLLQNAIFRLH